MSTAKIPYAIYIKHEFLFGIICYPLYYIISITYLGIWIFIDTCS